jgi:hypothetical protein
MRSARTDLSYLLAINISTNVPAILSGQNTIYYACCRMGGIDKNLLAKNCYVIMFGNGNATASYNWLSTAWANPTIQATVASNRRS